MKLETQQRLGGAALIGGAALFLAYSILFATVLPAAELRRDMTLVVRHAAYVPLAVVAFAGVLLMMGGFAAVYGRLRDGGGPLAFVGFLVLELAYLLQAAKVSWEFSVYPTLAGDERFAPLLREGLLRQAPTVLPFRWAMMATIFAGIALFGAALLRSRAFPKAGGALFVGGAVLYGFGPMLGAWGWLAGVAILAAGCVLLGARLMGDATT